MSKSTTAVARRDQKDQHELESNIVKALSHPLRMRILTRLNEGVASPNEMAKEFEESLPLVSYHVRILRELDCIELVRTTPRRGAIEHHYRALTRPFLNDDDWAQLPPSARKAVSNTVLSKALGDVRNAVAAGTFDDRSDRHLSYTSLALDEEGWRKLGDRLNELLEWVIEEQAAAAGRLQDDESGGGEVRSRLTLLHYTAPPAGAEEAPPKRRRAKR
ncbi:MAG TPA: helix-turn-helix domain-containing protein [Baekduia sp.]|uniref:helix-turn-helix domain-containing protein n=1 Tax=Baekduia sp. TaxID=2600305 RepID=UPI002D76B095|nr:helix-turn-helix domain-containing protein [Baekduia sp.]HET6506034.1 helix-turn-helix domain-containing protein [Baekduia sp.]